MDLQQARDLVEQRRRELQQAEEALPYHSLKATQLIRLEEAEAALAQAEELLRRAEAEHAR